MKCHMMTKKMKIVYKREIERRISIPPLQVRRALSGG